MTPLITIGIPTFNQPGFLRQAISSVLQQTWQEFEVVVVDDCSTDDTREVVEAFGDPRIRYFRTERNLRPPRSWNVCAHLARGDYFALLPHDDLYLPGFLDEMVRALKADPLAGFAQCAFNVVDEQLRLRERRIEADAPLRLSGEDALIWQMERLACNPAALLFRMEQARKLGFWREDYWDDWAFIVKLAFRSGFVYVPACLSAVRSHDANLSRMLGWEGRDGPLDILNQEADVFGHALPVSRRLLAFRAKRNRMLSYSCLLVGIRGLLSGNLSTGAEQVRRALLLYPCVPIDPRILAHILRGIVRRLGVRSRARRVALDDAAARVEPRR